jgi:hypothetical protein
VCYYICMANNVGAQERVRDWTVNLYYLPRCPAERADRSGWYAYAEHASGSRVPTKPLPSSRRAEVQADFDRLVALVR